MKKVLSIFLLFFLIITFNSCEKRSQGLTITKGVLTVGVEVGYPPMEYYDTDGITLLGFDIELTKALAEKLGLEVRYIDTAWEGILAGLDANRYDIAVNITILPERERRYNFTKPYISSWMTIVTNNNSSFDINMVEDIAGLKAAFQGDTTAQYFAEGLAGYGIIFTQYSYDKIIYCFEELRLGRVDFIIVDNIAASYYIERENSPFQIAWQGPPHEYIGFCLKKGNDALTTAIDNALDELYKDRTYEYIYNRIFNKDFIIGRY
ncbi:MAG: ABC transporter substrate-binding protein [Treponema sp.]|nr:ABC transporter substrate-binding protein [Treponema sp.]